MTVQSFFTDNVVFTFKEFMKVILCQIQHIIFSGVGSAHQNGVAYRSIKIVVYMAQTMLIHSFMKTLKLLWHPNCGIWVCTTSDVYTTVFQSRILPCLHLIYGTSLIIHHTNIFPATDLCLVLQHIYWN